MVNSPAQRILTDDALCRDCQACVLACSLVHAGRCQPGLARLTVAKDMARYEFHIVVCQHCDDPACVEACPAGAIVINHDGIALIQQDECLQCGACADSCPHGAIVLDEESGQYLKCDLCVERSGGPICVAVCPVLALTLADRALAETD